MTHENNAKNLLDVLIIGAGPAGLACAETLQRAGLRLLIVEKGPIGSHIAQYPTFMRFFSTNDNLEIAGFPLGITEEKPSRREYLKYLTDFARYHKLSVENYVEVVAVTPQAEGGFAITGRRQNGKERYYYARAVVVAVGAWEMPRRLTLPGADLPKVHERMLEPHYYVGQKVLVVGGRNSAIEAALTLWRAGADVSLSYRRHNFDGVGVKYWLRPDIDNRIKNDEVHGYLGSNVVRIDDETVTLHDDAGKVHVIENDFVLPMLGYDPPVDFLKSLGLILEEGSNKPEHNPETLESNIPGIFIAGVITSGNISGHVFIENSREHGKLMLPRLKEIVAVSRQARPLVTP